MSRFKVPMIATAIILVLALVVSIGMITWVHGLKIPERQKQERAQKLGGGVGVATVVAIAPFWLIAAAKLGKERRETAKRKGRKKSDAE